MTAPDPLEAVERRLDLADPALSPLAEAVWVLPGSQSNFRSL
jgi:hypothetical protein